MRYVPVDNGVHVFSAAGSFGLAGASAERLLDRLAGHLDGTHTVDSIVAGLPDQHRQVVTELIETLVMQRLASDADVVQPHQLQDWELARYQQEVAYAELSTGSGAHRFERFRHSRVLMVGAGGVLDALVETMLQLGSCGSAVLITGEDTGARQRYREVLADRQRDDPLLRLSEVTDPVRWDSVADLTARLAGYQAVLHCDDQAGSGRAVLLSRAARAAGVPALHALVTGDLAWVGPTDVADHLGCWECAWRYHAGAVSEIYHDEPTGQSAGQTAPPPADRLTTTLSGVVGATLAMALFRLVTEEGLAEPPTSNLIQIDLETAVTERHPFRRHPGCRACPPPAVPSRSSLTQRIEALRGSPMRTDDDLSEAAADAYNPALGALLSVDEGDHPQLPLVLTSVSVNDLTGAGTGPQSMSATAPDYAQARLRAAVRAFENLASQLDQVRSAAGPGWAWDLATAAAVPAPVNACHVRRTVAAGYSWAEAVGRGLLRHCHRLTAESVAGGYPLTELPAEAQELLQAAEILGTPLRVDGLPGSYGVPAVAVHGGSWPPAVVSAPDLPAAAITAVEAAVGRVQGVDVAADIPPDLGDERWPDRLPQLVDRVVGGGWQVVARPIETGPALPASAPPVVETILVAPGGRS